MRLWRKTKRFTLDHPGDDPRIVVVIKTSKGAKWLLPQVTELLARGAKVTAVLPDGPGTLAHDLRGVGAAVIELPWDFSFSMSWATLRGVLGIRSVVRRASPSAVFYHLYASALAARIATLWLPARRVMMVAGPLYLESRVIRFVERFACRLDTEIIAGSDYTRALYEQIGFPKQRLHTIPYGVDCTKFKPETESRLDMLEASDFSFVAIMVAFVYAPKGLVFPGVGIKGHELILDAWGQFNSRHPESLLVLLGGGFNEESESYRAELMAKFDIPRRNDVRWFNSVADVRPYYRCADVSVSPSLSENHGAALEASAMGVPCIVSAAGGLPETVTPTTGWCVPVGDVEAIVEALEEAWEERQSGALAARSIEARIRVEREFDEQVCSARVADVVLGQT